MNTTTLTARERKAQESRERKVKRTVEEITTKSSIDNVVNVQAVKTAQARLTHGSHSDEYGHELIKLATIISQARLKSLRSKDHTYREEFSRLKGDITKASKWETYIETLGTLYNLERNKDGDLIENCTDKKRASQIERALYDFGSNDGFDLISEAYTALLEAVNNLEKKGAEITEKSLLQVYYVYIPHSKVYKLGDIKPRKLWQVTATNAVTESGKAVSRYVNSNRAIRESIELYSALETTIHNEDGTTETITQYHKVNPLTAQPITDINGKVNTIVSNDNDALYYEEITAKCNLNKTERYILYWHYIGGRYSETIHHKNGTTETAYKYGTKSFEQIADKLRIDKRTVERGDVTLKEKMRKAGIFGYTYPTEPTESTNTNNVKPSLRVYCYIANDVLYNDGTLKDLENIDPFMVFDSIGKASKILNVDKSKVSKVVRGQRKQTAGYVFIEAE